MSKIVQDYMLTEVIGSGQYGKVWKAKHVKTGEPFAIKSISIQQISGVEKLREFVNSEIAALEQMQSRNIVKYFGKLQTTNNIYLIFEFCRGGTLEDLVKREGMLSEPRAMQFFDQILNAFVELHRLNIMHRDLKPSNVLLDNNEAKLADFGFCKKMKGEFEMTKSIVGSPIYMAPELLQGRYYCAKADLWSLGVLLYEMLHGKCPYEENSIPTLLEKIKNSELKIMPSLSLEIKQLLEGLLTFNPSSRISWTELFKRISHFETAIRTETTTVSSYGMASKELGVTTSYLPGDFDRYQRHGKQASVTDKVLLILTVVPSSSIRFEQSITKNRIKPTDTI